MVAFRRNWGYFTGILKFLMVCKAFAWRCTTTHNQASVQEKPATRRPYLLIGECAEDGFDSFIPDGQPRTRIARTRGMDMEAGFGSRDGDGVTFWFVRERKTIYSFKVTDRVASGVWLAAEFDKNPDTGPQSSPLIGSIAANGFLVAPSRATSAEIVARVEN